MIQPEQLLTQTNPEVREIAKYLIDHKGKFAIALFDYRGRFPNSVAWKEGKWIIELHKFYVHRITIDNFDIFGEITIKSFDNREQFFRIPKRDIHRVIKILNKI